MVRPPRKTRSLLGLGVKPGASASATGGEKLANRRAALDPRLVTTLSGTTCVAVVLFLLAVILDLRSS